MSDEETPVGFDPQQMIAIAKLVEAADKGHADAQYQLGVMYGNGEGVPLNLQEAERRFMQAAAQGHEDACITLAWMYANGAGVDSDEEKARDLYTIAARHGSAKAQYVVATMYRFAQYGVQRDIAQALEWYQKAANQGMPTAQFALGKMLMEGKHVAQDDAVALQWLMLAHTNGSKRAQDYIDDLVKRMAPEDVAAVRSAMLGGGS